MGQRWDFVEVARGLEFPEGPIAMPDGTLLVVEIFGERLTRIFPDGTLETVAEIPGGPNGAALGPDGAIYICNNGRTAARAEWQGSVLPGAFRPEAYIGGRIQRVDLATGTVSDLYTECHGHPLRAPNDLVMDGLGGFYFTDLGIRDWTARTSDLTAIYYARCDGSEIREVVFPVESPNGVGLSPAGDMLYWAETQSGRIFQRRIAAPGEVLKPDPLDPGLLCGLAGWQFLDSLAVDSEGWVCVATIFNGGITAVAPDGSEVVHVPTDDLATTNICFGGDDLCTAYITLSGTGRVVSTRWPRPGLRLHHT